MYKFNVEKTTADLINWIKDWFEENGKGEGKVTYRLRDDRLRTLRIYGRIRSGHGVQFH